MPGHDIDGKIATPAALFEAREPAVEHTGSRLRRALAGLSYDEQVARVRPPDVAPLTGSGGGVVQYKLWSLKEFRRESATKGKRDSQLRQIDEALGAYHRDKGGKKLNKLFVLQSLVEDWLDDTEAKREKAKKVSKEGVTYYEDWDQKSLFWRIKAIRELLDMVAEEVHDLTGLGDRPQALEAIPDDPIPPDLADKEPDEHIVTLCVHVEDPMFLWKAVGSLLGKIFGADDPPGCGHAWVRLVTKVKGRQKASYTYGFWPKDVYRDLFSSVPGQVVNPDTEHEARLAGEPDGSRANRDYKVDKGKYTLALERAQRLERTNPAYDVVNYSCTTFARDVLAEAGVSFPTFVLGGTSTLSPNWVYSALIKKMTKEGEQKQEGKAYEPKAHEERYPLVNLVASQTEPIKIYDRSSGGSVVKDLLAVTEVKVLDPDYRTKRHQKNARVAIRISNKDLPKGFVPAEVFADEDKSFDLSYRIWKERLVDGKPAEEPWTVPDAFHLEGIKFAGTKLELFDESWAGPSALTALVDDRCANELEIYGLRLTPGGEPLAVRKSLYDKIKEAAIETVSKAKPTSQKRMYLPAGAKARVTDNLKISPKKEAFKDVTPVTLLDVPNLERYWKVAAIQVGGNTARRYLHRDDVYKLEAARDEAAFTKGAELLSVTLPFIDGTPVALPLEDEFHRKTKVAITTKTTIRIYYLKNSPAHYAVDVPGLGMRYIESTEKYFLYMEARNTLDLDEKIEKAKELPRTIPKGVSVSLGEDLEKPLAPVQVGADLAIYLRDVPELRRAFGVVAYRRAGSPDIGYMPAADADTKLVVRFDTKGFVAKALRIVRVLPGGTKLTVYEQPDTKAKKDVIDLPGDLQMMVLYEEATLDEHNVVGIVVGDFVDDPEKVPDPNLLMNKTVTAQELRFWDGDECGKWLMALQKEEEEKANKEQEVKEDVQTPSSEEEDEDEEELSMTMDPEAIKKGGAVVSLTLNKPTQVFMLTDKRAPAPFDGKQGDVLKVTWNDAWASDEARIFVAVQPPSGALRFMAKGMFLGLKDLVSQSAKPTTSTSQTTSKSTTTSKTSTTTSRSTKRKAGTSPTFDLTLQAQTKLPTYGSPTSDYANIITLKPGQHLLFNDDKSFRQDFHRIKVELPDHTVAYVGEQTYDRLHA